MEDMEPDRLSSLPDNILENILSYIPIKEAVGTSVLSSTWINKWKTVPRLVFDGDCVSVKASEDPSIFNTKFVKIVDHVLLVHYGPINVFKICDYNSNGVSLKTDVDRWILHLTRRSIQELVLEVPINERYQLPWCLFSCQTLHYLELFCCWLNPPTKSEGFKNLKILALCHVTISQDDFENLISNCSLLEILNLIKVYRVSYIKIHAPNLKEFNIQDEFEDISFYNTFQLTSMNIVLDSENDQIRLQDGGSSTLLKFFNHLALIKHLAIEDYFLKYLAAGVIPVKLPTPCIDLSSLFLSINFHDLKEISAALCLLRSSPALKRLEISARIEQHSAPLAPISESYCWEDTFSKPDMSIPVRSMTINNVSGFRAELDFIKFLLLHSPVLEKLIVKRSLNVGTELLIEIIKFKTAAKKTQVIYNKEDSSAICLLFESSKLLGRLE